MFNSCSKKCIYLLFQQGKLTEALDSLLSLEKQTRTVSIFQILLFFSPQVQVLTLSFTAYQSLLPLHLISTHILHNPHRFLKNKVPFLGTNSISKKQLNKKATYYHYSWDQENGPLPMWATWQYDDFIIFALPPTPCFTHVFMFGLLAYRQLIHTPQVVFW